jgi:hypothetical protein
MQRIREALALVLVALLPFHALFITVATRVLLGPGHAPMGALALWKEGLIVVIGLIAVIEILRSRKIGKGDAIDGLIVGLTVLLLGLSFALHVPNAGMFYGFKYDLFAPLAFLVLRRVPWSESFKNTAITVLLWAGSVAAAYGIITIILPEAFFVKLGYSDAHSLYQPNGPLSAFQQIAGAPIRRVQGPMSGPNQFGIWLLIPFAASLVMQLRRRKILPLASVAFVLTGLAIFCTFSRSAWIAAFIVLCASVLPIFPRKIIAQVVGAFAVIVAIIILVLALAAPRVIVRIASSKEHVVRPLQAIHTMFAHPLGLGLAAAGPAANRTHDACVYLEEGADASWANGNPELCVFGGIVQLQPQNRICDCAFLPENWYLQLGVEGGVIGFAAFLALTVLVILRLRKHSGVFESITLLSFVGISVAALFLHAWEDSAVAYSVWMMTAIALRIVSNKNQAS